MYFAVIKYLDDPFNYKHTRIFGASLYVLDTSDWTVEKVDAEQVIESDVGLANIWINNDKFSITVEDFINSMVFMHELHISSANGSDTFELNISGRRVNIKVNKYCDGSDSDYKESIYVNGSYVMTTECDATWQYAFVIRDYIVIRLTAFIGADSDRAKWCSIAIDKNGDIHYWTEDKCEDSIGTMIDMISEV